MKLKHGLEKLENKKVTTNSKTPQLKTTEKHGVNVYIYTVSFYLTSLLCF